MNFLEANPVLGTDAFNDQMDKSKIMQTSIQSLEEPKTDEALENQNLSFNTACQFIKDKFTDAKHKRRSDELRWLEAYRNYRGIYSAETEFTSTEKSRIFVKVTKTKVLAAYSQITEVLFSGNKFPIGVIPSKQGKELASKVTVQGGPDPASQMTTGNQMEGGDPETSPAPMSRVIRKDILEATGVFKDKLTPVKDKLKEGALLNGPEDIVFEPAKEAGRKMEDKIQDQLAEAEASKEVRHVAFEMACFGHGVMKGPMGVKKEYPKWDKKGNYTPEHVFIPDLKYVSIWDFYPDPDAKNINDSEYIIQRHRLSKSGLRDLKKRPSFRKNSIEKAIEMGTDYVKEYWEHVLDDNEWNDKVDRYEVLEYWGYIDQEVAKEMDVEIPSEFEDNDQIQVNIWICNDQVLRFVLNPFKPQRIPYHSCPYELNPYSFFGIGVAENMNDTQMIMNGFMRLMIDNGVLSSNVVFEVDESNLVPGQDMTLYPGKIFRRSGGAPGQSIFATKFQNVTNESMMVFDKARQLADEATGMPSYAHGQTGIQGIGRTASGISMLMGAAAQNIKAVVRNIDDYLLVPLGRDMFAFNMQFNFDKDFIGDIEVVARGTESLMRNEIRSQKILQFLQLTANPLDAPFTKREFLLRELAASLDLDPELSVNDTRQAKLNAQIMASVGGQMQGLLGGGQGAPGQQQGQGGPNGVPTPGTGGGAETGGAQPGIPQVPGSQGFSANKGGMNNGTGNTQ